VMCWTLTPPPATRRQRSTSHSTLLPALWPSLTQRCRCGCGWCGCCGVVWCVGAPALVPVTHCWRAPCLTPPRAAGATCRPRARPRHPPAPPAVCAACQPDDQRVARRGRGAAGAGQGGAAGARRRTVQQGRPAGGRCVCARALVWWLAHVGCWCAWGPCCQWLLGPALRRCCWAHVRTRTCTRNHPADTHTHTHTHRAFC
jgi:hypothetical protein